MTARVSPPKGKLLDVTLVLQYDYIILICSHLIQKHHLQVKRVVKAPPITGAETVAIPYIVEYEATKIGRRSRGSAAARILNLQLAQKMLVNSNAHMI